MSPAAVCCLGCLGRLDLIIMQHSTEDRVLWYFNTFKDWDINNGTKPNEDDILVYGGQGDSELRPHYVQANQWHVASDMSKGYSGQEDYIPVELTIKCADGSETERPAPQNNLGSRPLLTDAEMDRQYAVVYKRAAKHAAREDDVNLVRWCDCVTRSTSSCRVWFRCLCFWGLVSSLGCRFWWRAPASSVGGRLGRGTRGCGCRRWCRPKRQSTASDMISCVFPSE